MTQHTPEPPPASPLDPLTLPLQGTRLIEASAGTGKTWTIAALFLRLVLGHHGPVGEAAPPPAQLPPPRAPGQILVMTFTRAATRELSDRIRQRLVQAAAVFRGSAELPAGDVYLRDLLAHHPAGPARAAAAWRLSAAADAMDDAAVFTIDAWCQRMLREHAFDSGSLFDEELQPDEARLLSEAARDHWRQQVLPLQGPALEPVLALWPDAQALARDAQALLELPLPEGAGQGTLAEVLAAAQAESDAALLALKAGWAGRAEALLQWLQPLWVRKDKPINGNKLGPKNGTRWLGLLKAWAEHPAARELDLGAGFDRLSPAGVAIAIKPGAAVTPPPQLEGLPGLREQLEALPQPAARLRAHAAACIAQRMQALKLQSGRYGFADMLRRLDAALDETRSGERALALRDRILQQYPAALIDEFQDTSPLQLRVFDRLYRIAGNAPERVLLLIGDPKQAIYGFRGADIHSYLQARRDTAGRHHVLGTNHRSSTALVAAVNGIFEGAEQRAGEGAFRFRSGGPVDAATAGEATPPGPPANPLPFVPVQARGRPDTLQGPAGRVPAVTLQLDATLRGTPESRERQAAQCSEFIVGLLGGGHAFAEAGRPPRPLRPADIAVLVRTGREAASVRRALRRRGVASVYLSDSESIFASAEAQDLLRVLQAVAEPRSVPLARAALATSLLGLSLDELLALAADDALFDTRCELLRQAQAAWCGQGVLAAVRRVLHGFALPARWLAAGPAAADGERRLTNVLHLAELLQAQSGRSEGATALLRWLAQQVEEAGLAGAATADEQVLRLESDADLVQVITVHKSKGLEYPVVCLPFAAHHRAVQRHGTRHVLLADEQGRRHLHLQPTAGQVQQADHERQREDLRLLYVALTRARHALWLGVAALGSARGSSCGWHRSALGWLVSGGEARSAEQMAADVQGFVASLSARLAADPAVAWAGALRLVQGAAAPGLAPAAEATPDEPEPLTRLPPPAVLSPLRPARPYSASFDRQWSISSYSALVKDAAVGAAPGAAVVAAAFARAAVDADPILQRGDAAAAQRTAAGDAASLPEPLPASDASAAAGLAGAAAPPAQPQELDALPPLRLRDDEPAAPAADARADAAPDAAGDGAPARDVSDPRAPWHRFPRGALAGNMLHDLLEWLAEHRFALAGNAGLQAALARRCQRIGWGHRSDDLLAWLQRLCQTPLPPWGAPLSGLQRLLPEMEFWLPSDGLDTAVIDALCRHHVLPGRDRPVLVPRRLQGLLMGFADGVVQHEGRFAVLDYKSNALGEADADYHPDALAQAMLQHRYDVQAALYLLALHRLLRQRGGAAYAPARDLHGAVYFFLRGVAGPVAGCFHLPAPVALIEALDALLPAVGIATVVTAPAGSAAEQGA